MKWVAALIMVVICQYVARAGEARPSHEQLKPLAVLVGKWAFEGKFEDGKPFVGEETDRWILNGNFLRGTGWFTNRQGKRIQFEITTSWDPRASKLVNWMACSDGTQAHRVGTFDSEKKLWKTVEKGVESSGREYSFDIEIQIVDENKVVWRGGGYKIGDESVPPLEFVLTRIASGNDKDKKPTKSKD